GSDRVHLEIQRDIQKHSLRYGVYLPLEDIFFTKDFAKVDSEIKKTMVKLCGEVPLAIWVPLLVRFPYFGERSAEWCWSPSLIK
ncbi:MAG: hypothetical protein NT027_00305, partial [Proteobacteria bacterium]|nr:hypothetical protein [Pseudomonadota bacterium]